MRKQIQSLHYLTQDLPGRTHAEQTAIACEAGIRWIQLRVKNSSFSEWMKIAETVRAITKRHQCILIINDNIEIAKEVNADGVHLGQTDASVLSSREILGDEKIIGLSTHNLAELMDAQASQADYCGLGPFRFTSTKEKLEPVLGNDIGKMLSKGIANKFSKPVIVIGGVCYNDVEHILSMGAYGIAVSSAINHAADPVGEIKNFIALTNQHSTIGKFNNPILSN